MEKIVLYSDKDETGLIASAFPRYTVTRVSAVTELVEALTREPLTAAVFVWKTREDAALPALLASLHRAFPKLPMIVLSPQPDPKHRVEGLHYHPAPPTKEAVHQIGLQLAASSGSEQRRHNRFGWPLKAALKSESGEWELHRLHSLSAGGAFFAHPRQIPRAGSMRDAIIQFQNCRLRVKAEVLDTRRNSSNLPFGFGVRFADLDEASSALIDGIVNDALVRQLLNPEREQEIPSIAEEALTPRFELT